MPSATTQNVLQDVNEKLNDKMNKDDYVVILAGSNDVYCNNLTKARRSLKNCISKLTNPNVLVVGLPHRYDLIENSCVNTEIKKANKCFEKICKSNLNSHFVSIESIPRNGYTQNGLHLNQHGKILLSKLLSEHMKTDFVNKTIAMHGNLNL